MYYFICAKSLEGVLQGRETLQQAPLFYVQHPVHSPTLCMYHTQIGLRKPQEFNYLV